MPNPWEVAGEPQQAASGSMPQGDDGDGPWSQVGKGSGDANPVTDAAKAFASNAVHSLPDFANMAAAGANAGLGYITGDPTSYAQYKETGEQANDAALGKLYNPQTEVGKYAGAIGQAIGSAPILGPAGFELGTLGKLAVSGAGAQGGGEIGEAVGGNTGKAIGELAGGVAGFSAPEALAGLIPEGIGAAAGSAGSGIKSALTRPDLTDLAGQANSEQSFANLQKQLVDRHDALKADTTAKYQALKDNGVLSLPVTQDAVQGLNKNVQSSLDGIDLGRDGKGMSDVRRYAGQISDLANSSTPPTLQKVYTLRQNIGDAINEAKESGAATTGSTALGKMYSQFKDFENNLTPDAVPGANSQQFSQLQAAKQASAAQHTAFPVGDLAHDIATGQLSDTGQIAAKVIGQGQVGGNVNGAENIRQLLQAVGPQGAGQLKGHLADAITNTMLERANKGGVTQWNAAKLDANSLVNTPKGKNIAALLYSPEQRQALQDIATGAGQGQKLNGLLNTLSFGGQVGTAARTALGYKLGGIPGAIAGASIDATSGIAKNLAANRTVNAFKALQGGNVAEETAPAIKGAITRSPTGGTPPSGGLGSTANSFLQSEEQYRGQSYKDSQGFNTVGYGFNLDQPNAQTLWKRAGIPEDFNQVKSGLAKLSPESAQTLLDQRGIAAQNAAARIVPGFNKLGDNQQAALTSLAYQLGGEGLAKFKNTLANLNSGNSKAVENGLINSLLGKQAPARTQRTALMLAYNLSPQEAEAKLVAQGRIKPNELKYS